ncbi:transposase domain-containing protein [Aeribacillus composti]|uniref:transposase domain-containing protein n=1 Tax=Aeribacillus composti TaxID=1868734 RepID=UPI00399CDFB0
MIGRRNWLFSNTPRGAKGSAIVYSIVETAKANGLNPYEYLHYLFQKLPTMDLTDDTKSSKRCFLGHLLSPIIAGFKQSKCILSALSASPSFQKVGII